MRYSGRDIAKELKVNPSRVSQMKRERWWPKRGATLAQIRAAYEANVRVRRTARRDASSLPPPPDAAAPLTPDSEPFDALRISREAVAVCWQAVRQRAASGAAISAADIDALKKSLGELRQAESGYVELAEKRRELIPREEHREIVGMLAARLVRCCDTLENSISTEFAVWLADPEVQQMGADERARLVRGFVAKQCRAVRQAEADAMKGTGGDTGD